MSKHKQQDHVGRTWQAKLRRWWRKWSHGTDGKPRPWYQSPGFAVFGLICVLIVVITIINYPNGMPEKKPVTSSERTAQQIRAEIMAIVDEGYHLVNRGRLELGMSRFNDALKLDLENPDAHFALMLACEGVIDQMGADAGHEQSDQWRIKAAEHAKYLLTAYRTMKPEYQTWVGEAFMHAARVHSRRQDWLGLKNSLSLARQVGFANWQVLSTDADFTINSTHPEFIAIRLEFLGQ